MGCGGSSVGPGLRDMGDGLQIQGGQCAILCSFVYKICPNNNNKKELLGEPLKINNNSSDWCTWFGVWHRHCFCFKPP